MKIGFHLLHRCLIAVATAGMAFAAMPAAAEGPGWSANSTVKKLVVTGDGDVNVLLFPQPTSCVSNGGYGSGFASVYPSHPGINRIKADLLAAYLTGGTVALYYSDNTCRVAEVILGGWCRRGGARGFGVRGLGTNTFSSSPGEIHVATQRTSTLTASRRAHCHAFLWILCQGS